MAALQVEQRRESQWHPRVEKSVAKGALYSEEFPEIGWNCQGCILHSEQQCDKRGCSVSVNDCKI
jgi:hypothetical protein